jgi:transcription-repair coupling factor (superfamily II helicase)
MLAEAVARLKGDDKPDEETATLSLGISLRIDASYIPEENQRLRMYKKIAGAQSDLELEDVRAELVDRYGEIPDAVKNLLAAGSIRIHCERLGIASLERKRTAIEEPTAAAKSAQQPVQRPGLAGRHGQAPVHNPLQHSYRQVAARPVTNATMAVRATTAALTRPGQGGSIKPMREMLYVKFTERTHAPLETGKQRMGVDPGLLMKLVSRNTKNGAQFTPQGVLRWPLSSAKAEDVLAETRALLNALDPADGS